MGIQLDHGSRFQTTDTILLPLPGGDPGGDTGQVVETFGVWRKPSFLRNRPNNDQIGKYQVQTGRVARPDLIATDLYGSPFLDWVIIAFNNATDVLNWPDAGAVIEYPLPTIVFSEID